MAATPHRRRVGTAPGALLVALVAALTLTGCTLRLETPSPVAPSPGAAEQVRARTVADSLALAAAARAAEPAADRASGAVLADVVAFSTEHAAELGGPYRSGLPAPTGSPTSSGTAAGAFSTAAAIASPDDVLAALRADATTALADATAADSGAMARLLAAIGVSRDALAARLAVTLNEPAVTAPTATPTAVPTPSGAPSAPGVAPDGLTADEAIPLVLAHDQAGFGFEVVAAKLSGDARTSAIASAATHRAAAETWARRVGIADTTADPRRAVYALPASVDSAAGARVLAGVLETGVADAAGAALADAPVTARTDLIDELATATDAAATWGAAPTAFPGIPGLAPTPTPSPTPTTPAA
ncbi:MAG: DUF4439 domain-containing protein [Micrococcales bacterium]|nr:DUF4439 domain-containing protein [Micrococcales bacterium]